MVRRPRREPQRGTYALVFRLARASDVCVGRLGRYSLRPAFYVYVGSAFGPGGLAARLKHHLGSLARPHWHVDYLRQAADLEEIWLADGSVRREHAWATLLRELPRAAIAVRRFGSSDCSCESHLFEFPRRPSVRTFQRRVRNRFPNDARVRSLRLNALTRW
jgi:Uri superfamily endonuclease